MFKLYLTCFILGVAMLTEALPASRYAVTTGSELKNMHTLQEQNAEELLAQYDETLATLRMENDILASLLNDQILRSSRRSRKRDLQNDRRGKRSFDSISHLTSSFDLVTESPKLRRLRQLIALQQQRLAENTQSRLPNGYEVLFPILQ